MTGTPPSREVLDRLFRPVWAGGWLWTRWAFVAAALWGHAPRLVAIPDAYAAADLVLTAGPWRLTEYVLFSPTTAYLLWSLATLGLVLIAGGGRLFRWGLLFWFIGAWALLAQEALNVKAHDRLLAWIWLAMWFSPAHEQGLSRAWRSPAPRWILLIVFCAIYGSTGWMKLIHEPGWLDGTVLQYHLVHQYHGGGPLAVWVSGQRWLTLPMCWMTLLFEIAFPILIWFRKANPWILVLGASFHLGIFFLMDVGPFLLVSLAAYPVLLHPEVARNLYLSVQAWRSAPDPAASASS